MVLSVVIIGAGISGLTLAALLHKSGISCQVVERDKSFDARPGGYSLTMQSFGREVLAELDLIHRLYDLPQRSAAYRTLDKNGDIILNNGNGIARPKSGNVPIPRQDLRRWIYQLVPPESVIWGEKFLDFIVQEDGTVMTQFESGKQLASDLLIAADGTFSKLRSLCTTNQTLTPLGYIVINGIAESNAEIFKNASTQWIDGKYRVFTKPYEDGIYMWQLTYEMSEEELAHLFCSESRTPIPWKTSKDNSFLEKMSSESKIIVQNWDCRIQNLVRRTNVSTMRAGSLYDRTPEDLNLKDPIRSCIGIIGDAAHPMTPFKGQGANTAMKDASDLAKLIASHPDKQSLPILLDAFHKKIIKRATRYVLGSRFNTHFLHTSDALKTELHGQKLPF